MSRAALALFCGLALAATALAAGTDPTRLPVGDGKVTTEAPRRGWVYACRTGGGPGGGAQAAGPWLRSDGTFDLTAKATVDGAVAWPAARLSIRSSGTARRISGNGLPTRTTTGTFPVAPSDDAYQYDRNPNAIRAQRVAYRLPAKPRKARRASCLTGGPIGIAVDGVAIFDALDAQNRDAVAHEVLDHCGGHPERSGTYHYHAIPACLGTRGVVGYALDGFPILGRRADGKEVTDADLDACHGHRHGVRGYHYHATLAYPYTLGCFSGAPVNSASP